MARRIDIKERRKPIPTIIGAGVTEQWYFTHLQTLFNYRLKIRPRFFGQEDIPSISRKIEAILDDGGKAICVFDADVSTWNDTEKKRLEHLRQKYSKNKNVVFCDSRPSIEYWFLLHFINTNRYFGTSKAVINELIDCIPNFGKNEGFLKNQKWVAEMSADGKLETACCRADTFGMDGESYSNVNKAINELSGK